MNYSILIALLCSFLSLVPSQKPSSDRFNDLEPRLGGSVTFFTIQRLSDTQGLYLIGETHNYDRTCIFGNLYIMQELCKVLRAADEDPDNHDQFHILVEAELYEGDYFLYDFFDDQRGFAPPQKYTEQDEVLEAISVPGIIHYGLLPLHRRKPFKQAVIENCEIRKTSGGAIWILTMFSQNANGQKIRNKEGLQEWFRLENQCELLEVTFVDIIHEFDELYQKTEQLSHKWDDPLIKKEFEKDLTMAKAKFALYRLNILNPESVEKPEYRARENESVFDYCERLGSKHEGVFNTIISAIDESFSLLLNAYLFDRQLELKKEKTATKIIFIGGEMHACGSYMHFLKAENRKIINMELKHDLIEPHHIAEIGEPLKSVEDKRKSTCIIY